MFYLPLYKGDYRESEIFNLQNEMYRYVISTMYHELRNLYFFNPYASLYFNDEQFSLLKKDRSFDHRRIQIPHDYIAAVFRYKYYNGEFDKTLFEMSNEEVYQYIDHQYVDTKFLDTLNPDLWYLTVKWIEFNTNFLKTYLDVTREIADAVMLLKYDELDKETAWKSTFKSRDLIKNIFPEIQWL